VADKTRARKNSSFSSAKRDALFPTIANFPSDTMVFRATLPLRRGFFSTVAFAVLFFIEFLLFKATSSH
jgi:hypothetical protein